MSVLRIFRNVAVLVILTVAVVGSMPRQAQAAKKKKCLPNGSICYFYTGAEPCCYYCEISRLDPSHGICVNYPF